MDPTEPRSEGTSPGNGDWTARDAIPEGFPELEELDRRLRALVRERPVLAVAAAVAAGYVLGRLFTRG